MAEKQAYERFTFFDNWGEIFDELSDEDAIGLFRGMYRYAFRNEEPAFEKGTVLSLTWKAMKPNIDSSGKAARNGGMKASSKTPSETPKKTPSEQKERKGKGRGKEKEMEEEADSLGKNPLSSDASDGAALADATPPAAPECANCLVPMERTSSHKPNGSVLYRCPLCAGEVWT